MFRCYERLLANQGHEMTGVYQEKCNLALTIVIQA